MSGGDGGGIAAMNVGDLVIDHREGWAGKEVCISHLADIAHLKEASFSEGTVGENGPAFRGFDGVIADEEIIVAELGASGFQTGEITEEEIEGFASFRAIGAVALEIVIKVGDVGEEEIGGEVGHAHGGDDGIDDPVAGFGAGERAPVIHEIEGATDRLVEAFLERMRSGVAALDHPAAVFVDGGWGCNEIDIFAHRLLPEHQADRPALGAEIVPDARARAETGALFPEEDVS